jgi:malate/lactate dehydrogenase
VTTTVILGAGEVGGATARQLAAADAVSAIIVVDDAGTVAQGKALDIRQAAPVDRFATTITGTSALDVVVNASVIVLADPFDAPESRLAPGRSAGGEWQGDAALNLLRRVIALNQSAPIVCAGAQQAAVVERAARELRLSRTRVFGSAPEALRSAVMSLAALEAGCAATDVNLTVVGRPPQQIIVPWEDASIAGRRATSVLSPPALTRLDGRLPRLWPPGPLALGSAATRAITIALSRTARVISAFVAVSRDESLPRVGMLPVTLNPRGVTAVVTTPLSSRDQVRLETALTSN